MFLCDAAPRHIAREPWVKKIILTKEPSQNQITVLSLMVSSANAIKTPKAKRKILSEVFGLIFSINVFE